MKINQWYLLLFLVVFSNSYPANAQEKYDLIGEIEILSSELGQVLAPEATIEVLAEGFEWSEGPVWVPSLNGVLFSDVPANKVYLWTEEKGLSTFLDPSGHTDYAPSNRISGANGLALDSQGKLILCQHGDRRIAQLVSWEFESPKYQTITDNYNEKRFNSPNDLTIARDGRIYFTDPPYGFKSGDNDSLKELEQNGIYVLHTDGKVQLLDSSLLRPNGITLTPDEKTLFVTNSHGENPIIVAFDVTQHGVENRRVFFDGTDLAKESINPGAFDGLKVHPSGIVFATGPGGVLVLDANGSHLGTIRPGKLVANCGFDTNYEYLYLTANDVLARIKLQ